MPDVRNRIHITKPIVVLALLAIIHKGNSQNTEIQDSALIRISKGSYIQMKSTKSFIATDTVMRISPTLVKVEGSKGDKTIAFYDSIESKMSKSKLARALFDLVIVLPDSARKMTLTSPSDRNFTDYEGTRIRNIEVRRLNVFGTSIDNPGFHTPSKTEKLLNSTHVNTNESIIRKFLLFKGGDTLSALTLSDNERIIRQLPFINDARIVVVPVSPEESDIVIITRDVYSLGADFTYRSPKKGSIWLFEKNIFGMGHELRIEIPYSGGNRDSPGLGLRYYINNIGKTFVNLNLNYYNGLGEKKYGLRLYRNLVSSETKYAGGISISQISTSEDLDTLPVPQPLQYSFQDYWIQRSFLLDRESVTRFIAGVRFINNNVYEKPEIDPDSYYSLQRFRLYMGSVSISTQKYYKTNLIYSYGRTEDIPYGSLIRFTGGWEVNEFKKRGYVSADFAFGKSFESIGYFHLYGGIGTFNLWSKPEQGVFNLGLKYFSNLLPFIAQRIRNFIHIDYIRGVNRYEDEYLSIPRENGFTGFRNDSLRGAQRFLVSLESVMFNPVNFYGFRFAFFGFADMAYLAGTNEVISQGRIVTGLGLGIRIRNDNLVFRTFQVKFGYYPSPPAYSLINYVSVSGEQLLKPRNFEPGPPDLMDYW